MRGGLPAWRVVTDSRESGVHLVGCPAESTKTGCDHKLEASAVPAGYRNPLDAPHDHQCALNTLRLCNTPDGHFATSRISAVENQLLTANVENDVV